MELPELSLAPTSCRLGLECNSSSESSDAGSSKKRKAFSDGFLEKRSLRARQSIDLQHSDERLPFDWEQCLDLQSGKMYFLNRKTLKKSWDRPTAKSDHHQQLNLELNISSPPEAQPVISQPNPAASNSYSKKLEAAQEFSNTRKADHHSSLPNYSSQKELSSNNMVAMACMNCHLLVIVSKSSPTCPNCKYVHSIPPALPISPATRNPSFKPLDTLSLFS